MAFCSSWIIRNRFAACGFPFAESIRIRLFSGFPVARARAGKPIVALATSRSSNCAGTTSFWIRQSSASCSSPAAGADPYDSHWRKSYCRFRCEAIEKRCPVTDDDYYYAFRPMCSGTEYGYCPVNVFARR